jgi:hypothetical protein
MRNHGTKMDAFGMRQHTVTCHHVLVVVKS